MSLNTVRSGWLEGRPASFCPHPMRLPQFTCLLAIIATAPAAVLPAEAETAPVLIGGLLIGAARGESST